MREGKGYERWVVVSLAFLLISNSIVVMIGSASELPFEEERKLDFSSNIVPEVKSGTEDLTSETLSDDVVIEKRPTTANSHTGLELRVQDTDDYLYIDDTVPLEWNGVKDKPTEIGGGHLNSPIEDKLDQFLRDKLEQYRNGSIPGNESVSIMIELWDQPLHNVSQQVKKDYEPVFRLFETRIAPILEKTNPQRYATKDKFLENPTAVIEKINLSLTVEEKMLWKETLEEIDKTQDEMRREILNITGEIAFESQKPLLKDIELNGGIVTYKGRILNSICADVALDYIPKIMSNSQVITISNLTVTTPEMDVSAPSIYASTWWSNGEDGGVWDVGILDTGIDDTHPALTSHTFIEKDFTGSGTTDDTNGHGTHVAGIIASTDSTYKGIAYGLDVILNAKMIGSGNSMEAADWAITNGADVLSNSWKAGTNGDGNGGLTRFFDAIVDDLDIPVVFAAANDGPNSNTIGIPSDGFNVITVGNMQDQGTSSRSGDSIRSSSSRGPTADGRIKPDLAAPGTDIKSTKHDWENVDITIQPGPSDGKDAFVNEFAPNDNYGNYEYFRVGSASSNDKVSYVQFSLSSIPAGSTIVSATLSLYSYQTFGNPQYIRIYQLASSWDENTVTWNNAPSYWSGEYSEAYISGTGWKSWDATDHVQEWWNGDTTNYGFYLRHTTWDDDDQSLFRSSDYSTNSYRPKLIVTYTRPHFVDNTGTSMAAPHVSGAVLLLMDYHGRDTPEQHKALLINTADDWGASGRDNTYGYGYMNLYEAWYNRNYVYSGTVDDGTIDYKFYKGPTYSGEQATIVWNRHLTYNGANYPSDPGYTINDLDLFAYKEGTNALIDNSENDGINNVEQVQFTSTTSDTVIKIESWGSFNGVSVENFILAAEQNMVAKTGPSLSLSVSNPSGVNPSTSFSVSVTVNNVGDLDAHGVSATLNLPSGFSIISGSNPQTIGKITDGSSGSASWTVMTSSSSGDYSISVSASSNSYGESFSGSDSNSIHVNYEPYCSISSPNGGGWYTGTITVTTSPVGDNDGSVSEVEFEYSLDNSNWYDIGTDTSSAGGWSVPWNTGSITDSSVWVRAQAKDDYGLYSGWDESDSSFGIDNTPPNTPIVTESHSGGSPSGWPPWSSHDSPYFTWSDPGDSGSGVSYYHVQVNEGTWSTVSSPWHPTYGDGEYTFDFMAVDGVGLTSGEYRIYVRIDITGPSDWSSFNPIGWVTSQTPTSTIQVRDIASGLDVSTAYYQYSIDGGSSWSGWVSAICTGTDGTTSYQTITAINVPFNQDSETQNQIKFKITDMVGITGESSAYTVKIDTVTPGSWANFDPVDWVTTQTPTSSIQVRDVTSGLDVSTAYYQYSTDGGSSWSGWVSASCTGSDGTTSYQIITASNVPFNKDSITQNLIRFKVADLAGLSGESLTYTVKIDATSPGDWNTFDPAGWINSQTTGSTILVRDVTSGLNVSTAYYQYSTNGGTSWSGWLSASCTGSDGTTNYQIITAINVPFNQDSETQNQIKFKITDMVGITGESSAYTVKIDTVTPGSWANFDPVDWVTTQTPTSSIQVRDVTSGLDVSTAYYQYSTDGESSWSGWLSASCSGSDGTTTYQTITASNVPFNQDSETQNLIKFKVADMAGLISETSTYIVKIDATDPFTDYDFTGIKGTNDWYLSDVTISLTANDLTSGVNYTMYQVDGGGWFIYTGSFIVSGDGIHAIEYYSVDNASNTETTNTIQLKIDMTSPTTTDSLSGTMGDNNWYTGDVTVTLNPTDTPSGLNYTMYRVDGGSWQTYTGSFAVSGDGTHTVEYYSVDNAGNTETTQSVSFKIDATDPLTTHGFTGTEGTNGWYLSDVTVTFTPDDLMSGINYTMYQIDGGGWFNYTGSFIVSGDGIHAIEYYSVDNANNTETTNTIQVKIDMANPTTTDSLSGSLGDNFWYISDVTVTLSSSDAHSGTNYTRYQIDGGGWQTYTGSFIVSGDGTHTVDYYSMDNASNIETQQNVSFKIDAIYPFTTHSFTGTEGTNNWYLSDVTFTFTPDDFMSGINYTMFQIDGGGWQTYTGAFIVSGDGTHTVKYYSVDNASNTETTNTVQVNIDITPPQGLSIIINSGNTYINSTTVILTLSATDLTSDVWQMSFSDDNITWIDWELYSTSTTYIIPSGDGVKTVSFKVVDYAGNEAPAVNDTIILDSPPITTNLISGSVGANDWYLSDVEVNLTAIDITSNVAFTTYRINGGAWTTYTGNFTVSGDRTHTVDFYSKDDAGNHEEIKSITIKIDIVPPSTSDAVAGTVGNNQWYVSNATIALTSSDATSGVDKVMYRVDGGSWQDFTTDIAITTDGTHTIEYYAVDLAGNTETTKSLTVKVDKTIPSTTDSPSGTLGDNNWYISDVTMTLSPTDGTGSGVNYTKYRINGGSWQTYTALFDITTDGTYIIEYYSVDFIGNTETTKSLTVKIDMTLPSTTDSPSGTLGDNSWYVSDVTVTLSASDGTSGVNYTKYRINGGSWQTYTAPFDITTDGTYTVEYYSVDIAGNIEITKSLTVKRDATSPEIISTSPEVASKNIELGTTITIQFSEPMNTTSVEEAISISPDAKIQGYEWSENNTVLVLTLSSLKHDTAYTVTISSEAKDGAGNTLSSHSWAFETKEEPSGDLWWLWLIIHLIGLFILLLFLLYTAN